jgi:WD40 repeat protein
VQSTVANQPLLLSDNKPDHLVFMPDCGPINHRRCTEAVHHMLAVGMLTEATEELCNPMRLCAVLLTLRGHTDDVNSVRFSSDGTKIASGACDGMVKLWGASTVEATSLF